MTASSSEKDYEELHKIGQGSYGVVFKVRSLSENKFYALKKIKLSESDDSFPSIALREISILKSLSHPNIVKLHKTVFSPKKRKLYLFFEYLDIDLAKFLSQTPKIPFFLVTNLLFQMLKALDYLHSNRIMHRDIKPKNMLLSIEKMELKLADFGLARPFSLPAGLFSTEIQSLFYRAPEILLGEQKYSISIDIWGLGCVVVEMCIGQVLFNGDSEIGVLFRIFELLGTPQKDSYLGCLPFFKESFPRFKGGGLRAVLGERDEAFLGLVERMLEMDPDSRVSAREALKSPLFSQMEL